MGHHRTGVDGGGGVERKESTEIIGPFQLASEQLALSLSIHFQVAIDSPSTWGYLEVILIIFQSVLSILKSTTEYLLSIFDYFEYHWILFFIILRVSFDYLSSIFWLSFEYFSFIIQYLSIIFQLF